MSFLIIPVSLLQLYYKQYHVLAKVNDYVLPVLIDTGSSISFIQSKYCSNMRTLENTVKVGRCFEPNYEISQSTIVNFSFDNLFYFELALFVQDTNDSDVPILLGADFLDVLQYYSITYDCLCLTINNYYLEIPRMFLTPDELINQLGL